MDKQLTNKIKVLSISKQKLIDELEFSENPTQKQLNDLVHKLNKIDKIIENLKHKQDGK